LRRRCRVYPPTPGAAKAAATAARKMREKEVWKQVDEAMDRMGTVAPGVAARLEGGFEWRCQAINSNVSTKNDAASDVGHSAGAAGGGAGGAGGGSGGGSETESEWNATSNVKLCGGGGGVAGKEEEWREGWSDSSLVSDVPPERDNPPSPLVKENTRGSGLLEDAETAEEGQEARGGRCHALGGEGGKKEPGAIEDRQMGEAEEAGGGGGELEEEKEEEGEEEEVEEEDGGRRTKDEPEKQEEKEAKEKYEKEKEKEEREWGALGPMAFLLRFDGMRYCRGGAGRVGRASATSGAGIPMQVGGGGQEEEGGEKGGGGHAPGGEEEDGGAGLDSALVNALEAAVTGYLYLCSSIILSRCVVS
jgi:hypothetical protein